ncbi:hypothetical protein KKB18_09070 [bacterium]|nr:hypothetical protein [bacterium]
MRERIIRRERILIASAVILLTCFTFGYSFDVRINWDKSHSPGVIGYNIYRSFDSGIYNQSKKIGTVNQNTVEFVDTNLTKGATYYYVVSAIGEGNIESDYSDEIAVSPFDYGDVTQDTEITPKDALWVLQIYDQSRTPNLKQLYSADMTHDGKITPLDALCILEKYTKKHDQMCPE